MSNIAIDGPRIDADVLILGGGLTGFAFRSALSGRSSIVLEKAEEVGGLLRMHSRGEYIFDSVPHVIFFRSSKLLTALDRLLDGELHTFARSNSIWEQQRRIPYPYQFNAASLPPEVHATCLQAFRENPYKGGGTQPDATFKDWLLGQFGLGFYEHFFRPYNEKLYGVPLDQLEAAPLRWTIPSDNAAAVEAGVGDHSIAAEVLRYPKGPLGIGRIVSVLEGLGSGDVFTGCAAERIEPERRVVHTSTGMSIRYKALASSLPLPELLATIDGIPEEIRGLSATLKAVGITVVAIGARRTGDALPDIWTYFPEKEIPFYRMTRLERISPELAPPGGTALLLECSGGGPPAQEEVLRWLDSHGVVPAEAIEHYETWRVPYAYVLFTRGYRSVRKRLHEYLASRGIVSMGRYGSWMYADIEMSIKSGISAARRLSWSGDASQPVERLLHG